MVPKVCSSKILSRVSCAVFCYSEVMYPDHIVACCILCGISVIETEESLSINEVSRYTNILAALLF